MTTSPLHPALDRQLRELGLAQGETPDAAAFQALLAQVSRHYAELDTAPARDKLKAQLAFNARLLEISPIPVFLKDSEGRYAIVNQAWLDLMALKQEEVLGRHPRELFGDEFARAYEDQLARFKRDGATR